jgi:hypothetical protein
MRASAALPRSEPSSPSSAASAFCSLLLLAGEIGQPATDRLGGLLDQVRHRSFLSYPMFRRAARRRLSQDPLQRRGAPLWNATRRCGHARLAVQPSGASG